MSASTCRTSSFWRTLGLAAALLMACAGPGQARQKLPQDLLNPLLGPDYATWLEGAVARMCTPQEISGFLALKDDAAAERFTAAFWERRNPHPGERNLLLELFDKRAAEADKRFSESGRTGRATDRGAVFVLYGQPTEPKFHAGMSRREPDAEVRIYKSPFSPACTAASAAAAVPLRPGQRRDGVHRLVRRPVPATAAEEE